MPSATSPFKLSISREGVLLGAAEYFFGLGAPDVPTGSRAAPSATGSIGTLKMQ